MKYLLLILISTPVFACKMTPEGGRRRAEAAANEVVAKKTGQKNLKVFQRNKNWFVRTTKLSCIEYKVDIDNGKGDCKTTVTIISQRPCP